MLIIDQKILKDSIGRIKRLHTRAFKEKDLKLFGIIEKLNREVVLALANFSCQKCHSELNLQIHHLIMRSAKKYMDRWRYLSQRYYFACEVCLCRKCHNEYHKELGIDYGEKTLAMKPETINRIKKKFLKT